ncbi:hypothetical protein [Levilactobacillus angrenensis]|uniref:Extracellular protein n=1 Tax=Levilactobacillus angrenensis TaxID=2486020 RepID=A0ABW1U7N2_9LACO|nr:hypothetical protein [Levilactobacillus angrenensis]
MLRQIKGLFVGLLVASAIGSLFLGASPVQAQAANKLSRVPAEIAGNWFIHAKHMGKFSHGKTITMHFTSRYADTHLWNSQELTAAQEKARHRLSKKAVKLVTKHPNRSQFMLAKVGKSMWNRYYISKAKNGKLKYVTDHYWVHAPVIDGIGRNDYLYTWRTIATHKFNTQPLRGKRAIVPWKKVQSQGTWYIKTP